MADDLHRKRSPVKNPECPSHVPHTSVPVPACKPGVSIRNRFQARNTEKTVKGYDIRRILFRFFPHKKRAAAPEKPARQLFLQEPVPALRDAPAAGTHLFTKDGNVVLLELFNAGIGQGVTDEPVYKPKCGVTSLPPFTIAETALNI